MFNSPAGGGVAGRSMAGPVGSSPVAGVMRTPELNQVSQMMSTLNVGGLAPMGSQQMGMPVRLCMWPVFVAREPFFLRLFAVPNICAFVQFVAPQNHRCALSCHALRTLTYMFPHASA